jgi:hypothetical protein
MNKKNKKNKKNNIVLIAGTITDSLVRLWFKPQHEALLAPLSIWGGVDARDESCGTVSVEIPTVKVASLSTMFPKLSFTTDAAKAMELWGV